MKKATVFLMSLVLAISMTACGGSSNAETTAAASTPAAEATSAAAETEEPAAEEEAAAASTEAAPAEAAATEDWKWVQKGVRTPEFEAALQDILDNATEDSLKSMLDEGIAHAGVEGNWVPHIYWAEEDPEYLTGFDVWSFYEVCALLGVEPDYYVASQWDGMLAGLQAGRYNILPECMTKASIENSDDLAITHFYATDSVVIIVAADNTDIVDIASMKGKKAGNSTTSSLGVIAYNAGCDCNPDLDFSMAMMGIMNGTIDLAVNNLTVFNDYINTYPEAADKLKVAFVYETDDPQAQWGGFAVRKTDQSLLEALNLCIDTLMEQDVFKDISARFYGQSFADTADLYNQ